MVSTRTMSTPGSKMDIPPRGSVTAALSRVFFVSRTGPAGDDMSACMPPLGGNNAHLEDLCLCLSRESTEDAGEGDLALNKHNRTVSNEQQLACLPQEPDSLPAIITLIALSVLLPSPVQPVFPLPIPPELPPTPTDIARSLRKETPASRRPDLGAHSFLCRHLLARLLSEQRLVVVIHILDHVHQESLVGPVFRAVPLDHRLVQSVSGCGGDGNGLTAHHLTNRQSHRSCLCARWPL